MNAELPTLDLALTTHRVEGIRRVEKMLLEPINGVRYVISWQSHENAPLPRGLNRPDVEVHRFDGKGLSPNRNNALDHCRGDIVLFSDDDLTYFPQGIQDLRRAFKDRPELDFATVISRHGSMARFPKQRQRLSRKLPKGYYVTSFEIAFRRLSAGHLRCREQFGLGSPQLHGGEDELFLYDAICQGLNCQFLPIEICAHPHDSTGTKSRLTPQNLMAQGAVIAIMNPRTKWLRLPLKAWRVWRHGQSAPATALYYLIRGAFMRL